MTRKPFDPNLVRTPDSDVRRKVERPLTVSQVTALVREAIDSSLPTTVHVVGEISNFKRHSSGHLYFTLKDRMSELSCVMWKSQALKLKYEASDGMEVIATGRVEVFERAGRYQLYVRKLEAKGVGSLDLAFRQLCERLAKEGLFEAAHKKPLPPYPSRIVVVTSPTGAAIADMLQTLQRRYPCVRVLIYPVRVQGDGAKQEIADAIQAVNANADKLGGVDLLIVGRGGGSMEDLWAFNEELVARAIFASRIPIVSAVGHETDVTVSDLVADVRAPTPTAAAELAVPLLSDVVDGIASLAARLQRTVGGIVKLSAARLHGLWQRSPFRDPLAVVYRREQLVDEPANRCHRTWVRLATQVRSALDHHESTVRRIAPHTQIRSGSLALRDTEHRLKWTIGERVRHSQDRVVQYAHRLERFGPIQTLPAQNKSVDRWQEKLLDAIHHRLLLWQQIVKRHEQRMSAMGYKSVLNRGFSITRTKRGRQVVRSPKQLQDRQRVLTELAEGELESEVVNLTQLELFD